MVCKMLAPIELLHGGEHHDDTTETIRRDYAVAFEVPGVQIRTPRENIVRLLEQTGMKRLPPAGWLNENAD